MSSTQMSNEQATPIPSAARVDLKLEVVIIPVSDVDRAKRFYESLGWRLDADFSNGADWRGVQLTPPGSPCSIQFGKGVTTAMPGSAQGLYLVVSDIEAARSALVGHGVDVSEVFHYAAFRGTTRAGPGPGRSLLWLMGLVQRSGRQRLAAARGQDAASRTRAQHGPCDPDRASARGRGAPWRVRTDRSEAPLVWVVRRLHRRARAGQDSRGGSQRRRASHRECPPMTRQWWIASPGGRAFASASGRWIAFSQPFGGTGVKPVTC